MAPRSGRAGRRGEDRAVRYLKRRGYEILERNSRVAGVEIDILARKDDILSLVEVKSRRSDEFGLPEEYVDRAKQQRMIRAARLLMNRRAYRRCRLRFDVVAVTGSGVATRVEHIENAFEES